MSCKVERVVCCRRWCNLLECRRQKTLHGSSHRPPANFTLESASYREATVLNLPRSEGGYHFESASFREATVLKATILNLPRSERLPF